MSKKSISSAFGDHAKVASMGPFKGVCPYMANNISSAENTSKYLEYTENMWRDPRSDDGSIVTFPGFRSVTTQKLGSGVHSARTFYNQYSGKRDLAVHVGDKIYIYAENDLNSEPYMIEGIADRKCALVSERAGLLVFDGECPKYIFASGEDEYSVASEEAVYIPTVYSKGETPEKRNLLSHKVYEERELPSPSELLTTKSLIYSYDESTLTCTVTGIGTKDTFVCIPSKTTRADKEYTVTGIADGAFYANIGIETLIIGADVSVGKRAFEYCTGLKFVAFEKPTGTKTVSLGERAFFKAPIKTLYININGALAVSDKAFGNDTGTGLEIFGAAVHFGGTASDFAALTGYESICAADYSGLSFNEPYEGSHSFYLVPVLSGVRRVEASTFDGEALDFGAVYRATTEPATVRYAVIYAPSQRELEGETVRLECLMTSHALRTSFGENETVEAVRACRIAVPYDGRIFLTGNPELPNTVFYTEVPSDGSTSAHPFYFPEGNVFDDGVSDQANTDMLASPSALIVIKADRGGVYYHRAADKSGKRVYPCEEGAVSVGGIGQGCAAFFNGSPCFVGENGVYLIKGGVSSEKKVYAIDRTLPELKVAVARGIETGRISLGELCGYLALCADGEIYLADPTELIDGIFPCWFKLADVGICDGDVEEYTPLTERLRLGGDVVGLDAELYASLDGESEYVRLSCPDPESMLECLDGEDCTGEVFESELYTRSESGDYSPLGLGKVCVGIYRELSRRSDEVLYCVSEKSGGRCGGTFDPCAVLLDLGGVSAFATEGGGICVFNTDLTGPEAYSFNGRAIRSVLVTGRHACGEPACAKTTVRGSVILSCPVTDSGSFTASCRTDSDGMRVISRVSTSRADASRLDFGNMSFSPDADGVFCVLDEKMRGFIYKQYRFADRALHRPFGVRGLTYRYVRSAYKQG